MKKVMIGVLVVIPIVILLIVAAVTRIVSVQAWVAVESMSVDIKDGSDELTLNFADLNGTAHSFYEYLSVSVFPERANRYTVEWQISDAVCTDPDYQSRYEYYVANKALNEDADPDNDIEVVHPAVMMVDGNGDEAVSNSSGNFVVSSYCIFTIVVQAEHVRVTLNASVVGYDVESITLSAAKDTLTVGDSMLLTANCLPLDSVMLNAKWASSDESVVYVDPNGAVIARAAGTSDITLTTVREDGRSVTSAPYTVTVAAGASSIFGDSVVTSKRQVTFEEIGVEQSDVKEYVNCSVEDGKISLNEGAALIMNDDSRLDVALCEENAVVISNAELFDVQSGYVLAVGALPISLTGVYADMLRSDAPSGAVWTSSDKAIATVDGGIVTPVGNGIVTISVRVGDSVAEVMLNVRTKVASMRLVTSDSALAVGLARQTVFGSKRYIDISANKDVEDNYFDIKVQGEPKTAGTYGTLEDAKKVFYDAYTFEATSGGEYVYFDEDVVNRVYFNSAALRGKPMQQVVVKVSAKYPKYQAMTMFTEESVTLNVVYGAAVSSTEEYLAALDKSYEYAHAEDNFIPAEIVQSVYNDYIDKNCMVMNAEGSNSVYSITLDSDLLFPNDYGDDSTLCTRNYGNLYGNSHMMHRLQTSDAADGDFGLINLAANDLTLSNVIIRLNAHGDSDEMTGQDAKAFYGSGISVASSNNRHMVQNARVEYTIIENGGFAFRLVGANVTLDGCIMRNMRSCSIYAPTRFRDLPDDTQNATFVYTQLTAHNNVCSNSLGTYMSLPVDGVLYSSGVTPRFAEDPDENMAWYIDNFVSKGYMPYFHQTGFLDIYNWQRASDGRLIDVGSEKYNGLIATLAAPMMKNNDAFAPGRVYYDDELYVHMGFVLSGIYFDQGTLDEPFFVDVQMEDDRFYTIESKTLKPTTNESDEFLAVTALNLFNLTFYCYKSDSYIQPGDSYTLDVDRLHAR